jgi:predicted N-formylglutamate amidohydrolase
MGRTLLADGDIDPFETVNPLGESDVCLVCEHAGRRRPLALGRLGLDEPEFDRHIAFDIGAEGVARKLSALLDAPLVIQPYSRLVYDCNRPPDAPSAMPEISETTEIPGNRNLSLADRKARVDEIYLPFHAAVGDVLDEIEARKAIPLLVTIHSFTPVYRGERRTLDLGILHDADTRLADDLIDLVKRHEPNLDVRRNEPYGPADGVTHTLLVHAGPRGIPNVMIEIRNDLIADEAGQQEWAERLARLLTAVSAGAGTRRWAELRNQDTGGPQDGLQR